MHEQFVVPLAGTFPDCVYMSQSGFTKGSVMKMSHCILQDGSKKEGQNAKKKHAEPT